MPAPATEYQPQRLAGDALQFWKARHLPPANGIFGPPDGPVLHQLEGGIAAPEEASMAAYRAVAADVDTRYRMLVGRRSDGTLRWSLPLPISEERPEAKLLRELAIWTGGVGEAPWDAEDRHVEVERLVGRLAHRGVIVSRDLPMRFCSTCVAPRSPERIIYQEEEGDTYLVRFGVPLEGRTVNALVWVDLPWRLLGASALLVHPDAPYVIARYRRKGSEELILIARSSLERFQQWLPDATFEVLEEHPGREFAGRPYVYPLRHEFPIGGALTPPAGTILAVSDVTGTGTGVVPLVPGHQSTDALIAESHGIPGWPLVTPRGQLDMTLVHKYAGLDLKTASEFVVRDLVEGDALFADLRVRRGVPHCMLCGTALVWLPGKAWCLEPGRLPPEAIERYRRLLPGAPALHHVEVAPWPVSETSQSEEPTAVALLECGRCERLDALDGAPSCPCGGSMFAVRRRLVPSAADVFSSWARYDPFPPGDSVRLYVGERRRVPALVHHLAGLTAAEGTAAGVEITVLPTLPDVDLGRLMGSEGTDAVRAALVRTQPHEGTPSTFIERCAQERRRLERLWSVANELLAPEGPELLASFLEPIGGHLGELEAEDRAFLARWERTRVAAIADYDRGSPAAVHRRVFRFFETDLADFRRWSRDRLAAPGRSGSRRSALRALSYVFRTGAVLLGPIVPCTAEAIHRRLTGNQRSLFESGLGSVERPLLDERLLAAWDRWRSFLAAVAAFRRAHGIDPEVGIPSAAIVVSSDEEGDRLREFREVLERLGRIGRLEIASPREPWAGRQRQVRPIEAEIQRVYPTQASQIAHLLRRMPSRRSSEPAGATELSVVIQGLPRRVFPSMVGYVETLPEGMVPSPWGLGELYLEIPGSGRAQRPVPPPLSPDAFWLVRHIERRLRRSRGARDRTGRSIVIAASDPLASELRSVAEPLARYLEISEVRVPEAIAEAPPENRLSGRTKTGARWWVDFPGLPVAVHRRKAHIVRPQNPRVPPRTVSAAGAVAEVDYSDEKVIAEEEAVRSLNRELDSALRSAVIGPAKVRAAWKHGFRDLDRFRGASFEELLALPGFGGGVAQDLVRALGDGGPAPAYGGSTRTTSHRPAAPRETGRARVALRTDLPATSEGEVPISPGTKEAEPPTAHEPPSTGPVSAPILPGASRMALPPASPPPEASSISLPGETGPSGPAIPAGSAPAASVASRVGPREEEGPPPSAEEEGRAPETDEIEESGPPLESGPSDSLPEVPDRKDDVASGPPAASDTEPPEEEAPPIEPNPEPSIATPASASVPTSESAAEAATDDVPAKELPVPISESLAPDGGASEVPAAPSEGGAPPPRSPVDLTPGAPSDRVGSSSVPSGPEEDAIAQTRVPEADREVPAAPATVRGPEGAPEERGGPTLVEEGENPALEVAPPRDEGSPAPTEAPLPEAPRTEETGAPPETDRPLSEAVPEASTVAEIPGAGPSSDDAVRDPAVETPEPDGAIPPGIPSGPSDPAIEGEDRASEGTSVELPSESAAPLSSANDVAPAPPPEAPRGGIELSVGGSVLASLQPFLEATAAGLRGICIVRESPERIRAQAGSRPIEIYWLTNLGRGPSVRPNDLAGFDSFLARAMDEEHVQLFFIEGVEYLTHIHGVEAVVAHLTEFDRSAREREVRVWLHVTPGLLRPGELDRIAASFLPPA